MEENDWYAITGAWLALIVGGLTFVGSWIFCTASYGFLFGFGLGWLPSGILAVVVGLALRFLWGFVALGLLLLGAYLLRSN